MKQLPLEELLPSSHNLTARNVKRHRGEKQQPPGHPQLIKYLMALKDISRRLDQLAKHDLPDKGILDLLEDTRTQVLSLHIARKQLSKKPKNKSKKHHRHSK